MDQFSEELLEERRMAMDLKSCVSSLGSLDGESVRGALFLPIPAIGS